MIDPLKLILELVAHDFSSIYKDPYSLSVSHAAARPLWKDTRALLWLISCYRVQIRTLRVHADQWLKDQRVSKLWKRARGETLECSLLSNSYIMSIDPSCCQYTIIVITPPISPSKKGTCWSWGILESGNFVLNSVNETPFVDDWALPAPVWRNKRNNWSEAKVMKRVTYPQHPGRKSRLFRSNLDILLPWISLKF